MRSPSLTLLLLPRGWGRSTVSPQHADPSVSEGHAQKINLTRKIVYHTVILEYL
ncbi:MAG: hypothetical protein NZ455_03960 [Bacteroidia bacterium]|nr:hypothetical protein [Bacteroidia bacterium]MDW8345423.1 hypothetical protein [Bacteroidia bacterium]